MGRLRRLQMTEIYALEYHSRCTKEYVNTEILL